MVDKPNPNDETIPPNLSKDLKSLYGQKSTFSRDFDANVLKQAKLAMGRSKRRRLWMPWATIGAVAAAAVIAVLIWHPGHTVNQPAPSGQFALGNAPAAGEKVNILPAYRLAKALKIGIIPAPQWDKTGDGKVDQHDVDAWAAEAVKLDGVK